MKRDREQLPVRRPTVRRDLQINADDLCWRRNQIETIHPAWLQIDRLLVPAEVLVSWQLLQNHLAKVPRESSAVEEDYSLDASTLLVAFILKNSQF